MAKILIAEDRAIDRQFLVTLLGYKGHQTFEASDGLEALQIARLERPELIISDVLMPTMDGYEFVRHLRNVEGVRNTPVIFYTATYHQREAMALAKRCGVVDILTKPSEPQVILDTIETVLARIPRKDPIESPYVEPFDREHARLVNVKLSQKLLDLEAAEHRLAAVVEFCRVFATERDPVRVLSELCKITREVTLGKHAVVGLVSLDGATVEQYVTGGFGDEPTDALRPPAPVADLLRSVVAERKPVRARNVDGQPESLGLRTGQPEILSYLAVPIASPSRTYGWLSVRNKVGAEEFNDDDEKVLLILGMHAGVAYENARLVEDLQRQATAVLASERRTHYALGAARMGIWEVELASDTLTWSQSMGPLFNVTPDRIPTTGRDFFALVHEADRQTIEDAMLVAVRDGTELNVEFRAGASPGTSRWISGRAQVLRDRQGAPTSVLGVALDVDDRRSLEAQLHQAQKLEAVGQLAGGVAHDFNNLLTAILGYSNFVVDSFEPGDQRRADLEEVIKAGQRAATLTKQLLALSRKQVVQMVAVDVNAVVTGMREMLGRLIGEHIEIALILAPELHVVRSDPGQIEQILLNLVVNARDAMATGGRIAIETLNVELEDSVLHHQPVRPGSYVMLAVTDSGVGMNEETKRRLFEPFFTTKPVGKGTGLGLATVYGIVKQSDGHIWVYSEPGKGATFKVYLPRAEENERLQPPKTRREAIAQGTETILVVEDEQAVRFLSRVILEKAGYRVLDTANAQEAEALIEHSEDRIHILVADVVMPGLSGPRLFERLEQQHPDLRVLYVSGYTGDGILREGHLDPGVDFLQKPFTAEALTRRVREVLDR